MKNLFLMSSLLLMLSITSCSSWMQVVNIDCVNTKSKDNTCYFENDSVLVSYYFWAQKGIMSFTVYNKLSVPIYIDWKKSSLISNSTKLDYWVDEEYTSAVTNYSQYSFSQDYFKPIISLPSGGGVATYGEVFNLGYATGSSYTNATKSKPERVTFIPPKSSVFKYTLHLTDFSYVQYDEKMFSNDTVTASYNEHKISKIRFARLEGKNVFLTFRNFLTLSTSENFTKEFYVDNEFKVKSVTMMKLKEFQGKFDDKANDFEFPYRKSSNYFYEYPKDQY